jgi:hypothetical protein
MNDKMSLIEAIEVSFDVLMSPRLLFGVVIGAILSAIMIGMETFPTDLVALLLVWIVVSLVHNVYVITRRTKK